jgi:hypothetical protein
VGSDRPVYTPRPFVKAGSGRDPTGWPGNCEETELGVGTRPEAVGMEEARSEGLGRGG